MSISIERWQSTWSKLGLEAPQAPLFDSIIQHYSEPHRYYHTVRHLEECFAKLEELRAEAQCLGEIELALWFHDAVYALSRHDNEEKSAKWAYTCLQAVNAPSEMMERVYSLVMATRHNAPSSDIDAKILVDVDLSILAAPCSRFQEYEQQIRNEYRHVPSLQFNQKRKEVLEIFLNRSRIFNTNTFFERYELQARNNIVQAIADIQ
jgi:predicted metal-dependent HD superfamily phosphohydrolase